MKFAGPLHDYTGGGIATWNFTGALIGGAMGGTMSGTIAVPAFGPTYKYTWRVTRSGAPAAVAV